PQDEPAERHREDRGEGQQERRRDVDPQRLSDAGTEAPHDHPPRLWRILSRMTTGPSGPAGLAGHVALVTGAGRGIGQATALALAAVGADIAALGLEPPLHTCPRLGALERRCLALRADVADPGAVHAAV